MTVKQPTEEQLSRIAEDMGLSLSKEDVQSYIQLLAPTVESYNVVDSMADNLPEVRYPRTSGYRPPIEENAHNAWYYKTSVKGAGRGKLKGKTVVLKDNIMLAGVPMMNGAATLEGYVPDIDATVVTRILDAGGEIVGKAHCENFCLSGGSHTGAAGPVHNPHRMGYSAGGSSSGSAVLVSLGEVDMAMGGDQGGSIRMPSSFCGNYGMKPTYGLVPYTGIMPIEIMVDHTGPITASVTDNALLLEVISGPDGYDSRQSGAKGRAYSGELDGGVRGMKIALVKEGFGQALSEADVDATVRKAADHFKELGATVTEVSIPWHLQANSVWMPIGVEGLTQTMMYGDGFGVSRDDLYVNSLMDYHRNWRQRANEMSDTTKLFTVFGTYIRNNYGSHYYGKAMNIRRQVVAAYDAALAENDLLVMPTTQMKPTPLPAPDASREEYLQLAIEPTINTMPFNITHHPAMSVPCGMSEGLPIGMMLIGKHHDESTVYRAAYAFEQSGDWRAM